MHLMTGTYWGHNICDQFIIAVLIFASLSYMHHSSCYNINDKLYMPYSDERCFDWFNYSIFIIYLCPIILPVRFFDNFFPLGFVFF